MKKHSLLTLLVAFTMMALTTASVAAQDDQTYQQSAQQTTPVICYVAGRFYLTPAEGLRRIGSWTDSRSASDECPEALARLPFNVGFIPNSSWVVR